MIYIKLLEFTERILTNSAHYYATPSYTVDEEVDCDGKHEHDKSEEVSVDMEEFELLSSKRKSSALLQTLKNVIETIMQNPKLCGHLQQISGLIGNSAPNQKTFKRSLSGSEPLGNGRSRSNSCSAKSTKKSLVSYLLYIFMFVNVHNLCGNIYLDQFKSNYSVFTSHIMNCLSKHIYSVFNLLSTCLWLSSK